MAEQHMRAQLQPIRLDGRVALVTGAGRGLGRAHALELAARGAAIVVNDPGVTLAGDGAGDPGVADAVVAEIAAQGGRACADTGDVTREADAAAMVQRALDTWGRLDIVVNNAGNLRHGRFGEIPAADLHALLDVHLLGSYNVSAAAWPAMAKARHGRIVFTTSQVGFYGKVDSLAYGMAKMGVIGLMHGMRAAVEPLGIRVNCISPFAWTRMGGVFPPELAPHIDPARVAAAVALLASDDCPLSGEILIAGGGHFALARMLESRGIDIDDPREVTAEALAARLPEIADMRDAISYPDALAAVGATFERLRSLTGIR